jgi:hypothetical protein
MWMTLSPRLAVNSAKLPRDSQLVDGPISGQCVAFELQLRGNPALTAATGVAVFPVVSVWSIAP